MATQEQGNTYVGRVKWFNNKVGYGFITITDGEKSGVDIFVNHRKITTDPEDQYKYLVEGEYVEFSLKAAEADSKHEYQAGEVHGIKGGKLMCETRLLVRKTRSSYKETKSNDEIKMVEERGKAFEDIGQEVPVKKPRSRSVPEKRGSGLDSQIKKVRNIVQPSKK